MYVHTHAQSTCMYVATCHKGMVLYAHVIAGATPMLFIALLLSKIHMDSYNPELELEVTPIYNAQVHSSKSQLENSFMYFASRPWNTLPLDLRNLSSKVDIKTYKLFSAVHGDHVALLTDDTIAFDLGTM